MYTHAILHRIVCIDHDYVTSERFSVNFQCIAYPLFLEVCEQVLELKSFLSIVSLTFHWFWKLLDTPFPIFVQSTPVKSFNNAIIQMVSKSAVSKLLFNYCNLSTSRLYMLNKNIQWSPKLFWFCEISQSFQKINVEHFWCKKGHFTSEITVSVNEIIVPIFLQINDSRISMNTARVQHVSWRFFVLLNWYNFLQLGEWTVYCLRVRLVSFD